MWLTLIYSLVPSATSVFLPAVGLRILRLALGSPGDVGLLVLFTTGSAADLSLLAATFLLVFFTTGSAADLSLLAGTFLLVFFTTGSGEDPFDEFAQAATPRQSGPS